MGEVSQAALETLDEGWGYGRLALGVTAARLGAWFLGLVDAKRFIQQPVRVGGAGVLCDEQQDAPVGRFEDGQQAPCPVEIQPANS